MRNFNKSIECAISSIKEIRQKPLDGNSTLEVLFEIGDKLSYVTAGNLAIYPENSPEHVETFAKRAGLNLDARFVFKKNENFVGKKALMPIPNGSYTVREVLTRFIDLTGPMSKSMLKALATKLEDQAEQQE